MRTALDTISRQALAALCFWTFALGVVAPANAEQIRAGGTGAATEMLRHLFTKFALPGTEFEVVPSLGSGGGIRAVADRQLDIAVIGRSLKEDEKAKGLRIIREVRTPHVLVTSHPKPDVLSRNDLAKLYRDKEAVWKDGTRIRIALRPKSDSENDALIESFPGMAVALDELRGRPDLPIAATDQDNADWAEKVAASLVSATFTQIKMEKRNLRLIKLDGVEPTLENLESGTYPIQKTLYFVVSVNPKRAVIQFLQFLRTPEGKQALRETGVLLVDK